MNNIKTLKKEIIEICHKTWERGMVAANDGNVSARVNENSFLITRTGISKGDVCEEDIILVDFDLNVLEGKYGPSSESKMHLRVYKDRPDVNAIVHTHSAYATSYAICNKPLDLLILPETTIIFGEIPVVPYGTTSKNELADNVGKYIDRHDGLLLENHGVLTVGHDLRNAYYKMEAAEHYAKISYITETLGGRQELPKERVQELIDIRKSGNFSGKHPGISKMGIEYKN